MSVRLGATADGVLTALAIDVLTDTGAYGNHSPGVMFHGCHESMALYRCPNKRVDARAVYTNNLPSGAFRGYGLGQVQFAIETALDELARRLGIDPFDLRRRNMIMPGDRAIADSDEPDDSCSPAATASTSASTSSRRRWAATAIPRRPARAGRSARAWPRP